MRDLLRPFYALALGAVLIIACGNCGGADMITVEAGPDQQVAEGTMVTLQGMGSASEFSWAQLSGPEVEFEEADPSEFRFEAPWIVEESVVIEFELTVSDGVQSASDTVLVTVTNTHFALFGVYNYEGEPDELYRTSLDGEGEPIKLSKTPVSGGDVEDFLASPDGRWVAYRGDIEKDEVYELFIVPSIGGTSIKASAVGRSLVEGGDVTAEYQWSPDSNHIAYLADQDTDEVIELYSSSFAGSVKINGELVAGGKLRSYDAFAWSSDSSRIAYVADQDTENVRELYTTASDGTGNVKVNGELVDPRWVSSFAWSPVDSLIAHHANRGLHVGAPDGSDDVIVNGELVDGGGVGWFEWSPDGSRIAYVADQDIDEVDELYTSAPDGNGNVKVNDALAEGARVLWFATSKWSPDSSRLAYIVELAPFGRELYSGKSDGSGNVKVNGELVADGFVRSEFEWSPDGSRIAYFASQDTAGLIELYTSRRDGSGNAKVNGELAEGEFRSDPTFQWSPDGSRIAYVADQDTYRVYELYTSAPDGSGNLKVNQEFNAYWHLSSTFSWSPDSSRIIYRAGSDDAERLYSATIDGSDLVELFGVPDEAGTVGRVTVE